MFAQINKNIIIIDDVITSGSTALGVAYSLKKLGANKIILLSIAKSHYYKKLIKKLIIRELNCYNLHKND